MLDTLSNYAKKYELQLYTGTVAVGLGYGSKKLLRDDIVASSSFKGMIKTFTLVALAGILSDYVYNSSSNPFPK